MADIKIMKEIIHHHRRAIKILEGTIKTGKVPNAFIFIGDPYVGKTETAIAYAKALNCPENLQSFHYCDICQSCKKIDSGIHPDVKIIAPEKDTITVNTIRELEEFVTYRILEGKYKVIIIKEAHKMNIAAANAFLKTVEEPPSNTTIILICDHIHSLPEPLVSRCFKIHFSPLSREIMEKIVLTYLNDNQTAEIQTLLDLLMGRPGFLTSGNIIDTIKWFTETLENLNNKKSPWKDNEEVKLWIDFFCILISDIIKVKIIKKGKQILPVELNLKKSLTLQQMFDLFDRLQEIRKNIDLNLNKSIVWNYTKNLMNGVVNV
ncbi:DNA polymerase III subunit [Thermodesulfovibrio hydrogeniphilus]